MKKQDTGNVWIVVCTVLVILLSVSLGFYLRSGLGTTGKNAAQAVTEMENTIKKYFYFYEEEKLSEDDLTESALRGMVSELNDPYAQYYTDKQYQALRQADEGNYTGIGISVGEPNDVGSTILDVYAGSPADLAGVKKGDIILSANGHAAAGLSLDEFLQYFSTDDNVTDELILLRGTENLTITLKRGEVHVNRVSEEVLEGNVGYIRITEFNGSVVEDFWDAATKLRDQGIHQMIIDLRDNPGGGLSEVLGVANYLIPKGEVVVTIKSKTANAQIYRSEGKERLDMDLVVLVNGNSASASELLTGALKDYGLATIVGTRTFGKGIVQSYFRLNSTAGWLKITTDAYYTPNDVCIHGVGIEPDLTVTLSEDLAALPIELLDHKEDAQLQAALKCFSGALSAAA